MNRVGILATLQARPGKEIKVEEFLKSATPLVETEVGTTATGCCNSQRFAQEAAR
jgi:hypothetical protein